MALVNYNGVQVLNPAPPSTADAGLAFHNNFKNLADRVGVAYFGNRDPLSTDDNSGVSVGVAFTKLSHWVNTITQNIFICIDPTVNAAVWINATGGGDLWPPI